MRVCGPTSGNEFQLETPRVGLLSRIIFAKTLNAHYTTRESLVELIIKQSVQGLSKMRKMFDRPVDLLG